MPEILSSNLKVSEGGTQILSSEIRIFRQCKLVKASKIRLSADKLRSRESQIRIFDQHKETLSSVLRLFGTKTSTTSSNLRLCSPAYSILGSSLRIEGDPSGYIGGNIGIRSLGRINLGNRESGSQATIIRKSSFMRVYKEAKVTVPSIISLSTCFMLVSNLRIRGNLSLTSSSRLRLAEGFGVFIESRLYIWDKTISVAFGEYPNVLLDGQSSSG